MHTETIVHCIFFSIVWYVALHRIVGFFAIAVSVSIPSPTSYPA